MRLPPHTPIRVLRKGVIVSYAVQAFAVIGAAVMVWVMMNWTGETTWFAMLQMFVCGVLAAYAFRLFEAADKGRREIIEMIKSREGVER